MTNMPAAVAAAAVTLIGGFAIATGAVTAATARPASTPPDQTPIPASVQRECVNNGDVNCIHHADGTHPGFTGGLATHSAIVRQMPGPAHSVCVLFYGDYSSNDYCT